LRSGSTAWVSLFVPKRKGLEGFVASSNRSPSGVTNVSAGVLLHVSLVTQIITNKTFINA
jgi:hypothetical protein